MQATDVADSVLFFIPYSRLIIQVGILFLSPPSLSAIDADWSSIAKYLRINSILNADISSQQ